LGTLNQRHRANQIDQMQARQEVTANTRRSADL